MFTIIATLAFYIMFAVGTYRGATYLGWKEDATRRTIWRARIRIALLSLVWPYLLGKRTQTPTKIEFFR